MQFDRHGITVNGNRINKKWNFIQQSESDFIFALNDRIEMVKPDFDSPGTRQGTELIIKIFKNNN